MFHGVFFDRGLLWVVKNPGFTGLIWINLTSLGFLQPTTPFFLWVCNKWPRVVSSNEWGQWKFLNYPRLEDSMGDSVLDGGIQKFQVPKMEGFLVTLQLAVLGDVFSYISRIHPYSLQYIYGEDSEAF